MFCFVFQMFRRERSVVSHQVSVLGTLTHPCLQLHAFMFIPVHKRCPGVIYLWMGLTSVVLPDGCSHLRYPIVDLTPGKGSATLSIPVTQLRGGQERPAITICTHM